MDGGDWVVGEGVVGKVHLSLSNFLRWTCTPENSEIQSFETELLVY